MYKGSGDGGWRISLLSFNFIGLGADDGGVQMEQIEQLMGPQSWRCIVLHYTRFFVDVFRRRAHVVKCARIQRGLLIISVSVRPQTSQIYPIVLPATSLIP